MIPTNDETLVKYDNPVLISKVDKSKAANPPGAAVGGPGVSGKPKLPPVQDKSKAAAGQQQTEEVLNAILPPRFVLGSYLSWMRLD